MSGTLAELAPHDPRIAAVTRMLRDRGVSHGDAVAWQLPNTDAAMALLWACWSMGAIAVPIHHRATDTEVRDMLGRLDVAAVIDAGEAKAALGNVGSMPSASAAAPVAVAPHDLALILHTSGSSGVPKAVRHSHRALAYKAVVMAATHGLGPDDCVLMPAPLAHISGILNGVLVPAAARMRTVLMERWDPDHAIDLIHATGVTFMVGPPTFFLGMKDAKKFRRTKIRSLRLISAGGAGVTRDVCEDLAWLFDATVKRSYGSTEAPTVATSHVGDPVERGWTTDGRAVGAAELRLSESGELEVRGPELFVGYVDAAQTAAAMTADGWFRTGDLATIDDGWLTITGRLSDVIIRGGENISPAEVEAVLSRHPAVRQAAVIGWPDERLGQQVRAVVELSVARGRLSTFGVDECRRWCEEQGLARFKWPEAVMAVDAIPLLPSGKPDRKAL